MKEHGKVNFNLTELDQYNLVYLSLGAGLQSSVMYYMACINYPGMPKIEYAAFAETFDEPQHTYKTLETLIEFGLKHNGPPIYRLDKDGKKLSDDLLNPKATRTCIPAFTLMEDGTSSMLLRKCTGDYKITVLEKFAKRYIGVNHGERMGKRKILCLQGITTDEAIRMKAPSTAWLDTGYPLCTMRMSRYECDLWLDENNLQPIKKSACVYCPFHSDSEWGRIKQNKDDWSLACLVDESIRDSTNAGAKKPLYLHRSCRPLSEIDFDDNEDDLFANQCDSGYCGL